MSIASTRTPAAAPATTPGRHGPGTVVGAVLALAGVLSLVLLAFALPAVNSEPHDVPVGVVAPDPAQVVGALDERSPGAFDPRTYPDEASLVAAVEDREVYGGIALTPDGPSVLTAPAGSPAVAQLLAGVAAGLGEQSGRPVPVTAVVPLPEDDPRGAGLASSMLPLLVGSVLPAIVMVRLLRGGTARLLGLLSAAVAIGAAAAGVMHAVGAFPGSWLADTAAMTAVVAASGTALLGLHAVAGMPGLGLGAAVLALLGNPLSGLATAPEFLAEPWSTLGAWLPPGAGSQLLRSVAYFDGAGAGPYLLVLGCWFALGVALVAVGSRRGPAPA